MGWLDTAVSVGTLGLVNDVTGSGAAATAMKDANTLASRAEQEMFDKNLAFQKENIEYQRAQTAPWIAAGQRGLQGYEALLRDPSSVTQNPGYQFRLDQGAKTLGNSYLAQGMGLSGTAGKGLQEYGQNYAMSEYDRALNRYNTLANYGTGAMGYNVQGAQQYGQNVGNLMTGQGQNLSNMYMNQGQIAANQATNNWNQLMGMGNLALSAYSMSGGGMPGGGGGSVSPGGGDRSFLNPVGGYNQSVGFPY